MMNSTMAQIPSQCNLMKSIYQTGFALDDVVLYLDTHPDCQEALSYYRRVAKEYNEMCEMYNRNYGPLTNNKVYSDRFFTWVDNKMPWEGGL